MLRDEECEINGVSARFVRDDSAHCFCLSLYVLAGTLYEKESESGITHLLEHTVFRSVKTLLGGRLYEKLVENCLTFDASTYDEFVCFTVSGAESGFPFALEILSLLFQPLTPGKEGYEAEKKRIKSEIRESDERTSLACLADKAVWKGTPLEKTITGTCTSVSRIGIRQLEAYRRSVFVKKNLFFCLTGRYTDSGRAALESMLRSLSVPEGDTARLNTAPVPADFRRRNGCPAIKNADFYRVRLSFDIDNSLYPAGARDLMYAILFETDLALVFQALSEDNPLLYSYDSKLEQYRNISVLKLEYETAKKNVVPSLVTLKEVFRRMKRGDFPFETVKRWEAENRRMAFDSPEDVNWTAAYDNRILGEQKVLFDAPDAGLFRAVNKEDIVRMANDIFTPSAISLAFKGSAKFLKTAGADGVFRDL